MFNFFRKQKTLEENKVIKTQVVENISTETEEKNKHICSINVQLNIDNTIDIVCHWPDLDNLDELIINDIANKYATMIYLLDSGSLKKDIADTLSSVCENNIYDTYFSRQVLTRWLELFEKQHLADSNQPLIKPSSVFKNYSGK
jgi:hypothetical protein